MRREGGHIEYTYEDGRVEKFDTFTCKHNNEIVKVPAGVDPATVGAFCRNCMGHICEKCAEEMERTLKCVPFERRLEAMESRARFRRSLLG